MEKIKKLVYGAFATAMAAPAVVFGAGPSGDGGIQGGIDTTVDGEIDRADGDLTEVITDVMKWLLWIVGAFAVLAIIIAAIMYITSGGDEGQTDKAKKTLIYACVGLLVALLGLVIINTVTGVANES